MATVLHFQQPELLERVVAAIRAQTTPPDWIVVVDNGSDDGSRQTTGAEHSEVVCLALPENVGVGLGHGIGWAVALAASDCEWLWVLEHDSVPQSDCLEMLLQAAQDYSMSEPSAAGYMPRTERNFDEAGRSTRSEVTVSRRLTFNGPLLSRRLVETVGMPRSDFFVGLEDTDYYRRIGEAGLTIQRVADAVVIHGNKGNRRHGISKSVRRSYYNTRNSLHYRRTAVPERGVILLYIGAAIANTIRIIISDDQKLKRIAARWSATVDGSLGRLGRRDYWFLK